jgi:hypothetical protein
VEVTTFFCDVLKHLFVEHQLGDEPLESFDLAFELADAARVVDDRRVENAFPAVIGVFADSELSANVAEREPLGTIAFDFTQNPLNLFRGPSLAHVSLPGLCQGD